jgi:hypothetical protein
MAELISQAVVRTRLDAPVAWAARLMLVVAWRLAFLVFW